MLVHHLHFLTPLLEEGHGIKWHVCMGRRRILASIRGAQIVSSR